MTEPREIEERKRIARETFDAIGLPALSEPAGFDGAGKSFGPQIVGAPFVEAGVLRISHAFEQGTRSFERPPAGF